MKRLKHILKETLFVICMMTFILFGCAIDSILDIVYNYFTK